MTLVPPPSEMPSVDTIVLPSRALLRSWRNQTIPTREAALEESAELYAKLSASDDAGLRDMALLGVIADGMQPLEDLAYLATAWDAPFTGLATYVRSTTYSDRIPTNFWQGVASWDDDRLDVLAGFAMRDPNSKVITGVLELTGFSTSLDPDSLLVLDKARAASRGRLRNWLGSLATDWGQFAPYFGAFKHGGLVLNRVDAAFVADDVAKPTDQTARLEPSLAVWKRRGEGDEVFADHELAASEVNAYVKGTGRLAIQIVDGFLESRLALLESIEIDDAGTVVGLKPELQIPWSVWLDRTDLTSEEWSRIGAGPRLRWTVAD